MAVTVPPSGPTCRHCTAAAGKASEAITIIRSSAFLHMSMITLYPKRGAPDDRERIVMNSLPAGVAFFANLQLRYVPGLDTVGAVGDACMIFLPPRIVAIVGVLLASLGAAFQPALSRTPDDTSPRPHFDATPKR